MIPIHIKKTKGAAKPPASSHYIAARNGLFLKKDMWWVSATVPVVKVETLDVQGAEAKLLLPRLPVEIIARSLKLAKAVYDVSLSEVCLLLHYGEKAGYQLTVPPQTVTPLSVDYDASERLPDSLCVGTIHSHGALHAFHSGTDHADEETADGVHITLGNIGFYPQFSLSAELTVNGNRFGVSADWFEGLIPVAKSLQRVSWSHVEHWKVPTKWLRAIKHPKGPLWP